MKLGFVNKFIISTGSYSAPLLKKKQTAVTFASQGDAHVRTDAQIKFLYYPLTYSRPV